MVSAVSTPILAQNTPPQAASSGKKKKRGGVPAAIGRLPWFAETDLSDEQDRAMNAARATAVFRQILRQLNRRAYADKRPVRREQAQAGLLEGVGIKGLARLCQCHTRTIRRRLEWLETNGYVRVIPNTVEIVTRDPLTGQIVTNQIGRRKAASIQLTVQACHTRPRKKPKGFDRGTQNPDTGHWVNHDRGTQCTPQGTDSVRYRGTQCTTFPSNSSFPIDERQPLASGESRRGSRSGGDDERKPRPFTGEAAARKAATIARLEREKAQRIAEDDQLAARRRDSLEATPMNPATVRAADAATAADKPPQTIRVSQSADRPRTAVLPRPKPARPSRPRNGDARREAEHLTEQQLKQAIIEQLAAAERAAGGVSMTRATVPIGNPPTVAAAGRKVS